MPWARVDDGFYDHPKAVLVGTLGVGLWALCLAYASNKLTDGFIPEGMIPRLIADVQDPAALSQRLVDARLFERVPGGYQMHDYLDYNPSRAEVLALREARGEAGRVGGVLSGESKRKAKAEANAIANAEANAKQNRTPIPIPIPIPIPDSHDPEPVDSAACAATPAPKPKAEPYTENQRRFLTTFNAKRFANQVQAGTVAHLLEAYPAQFWEATTWAAERGLAVGQAIGAIKSALPKWGQRPGQHGTNQTLRGRGNGTEQGTVGGIATGARGGYGSFGARGEANEAADDLDRLLG